MSQTRYPEVLPIPRQPAAVLPVPPPLPAANFPPPPLPKAPPAPRFSFLRFIGAVLGWMWHWLVGAGMCFNLLALSWITSIVAVGWTNRVVQMMVLRSWWWRSDLRNRLTFAAFCEKLGPDAPSPRPRWIVQNGLRASLRRPVRGGGKPGLFTLLGRMLYWPWFSLWLNFKVGLKATLCTYALTGLPCLLMLWSWEQGWINSWNGGYEQAWVGPTMGFLGIFVFVAMMFYVPMAQAHQAATGQARAFFDFPFIWQLVRSRITAYVLLAVLIGLASLILNIGRGVVITNLFRANAAPNAQEGLRYFAQYLFVLSLLMFPVYVVLRIFGGLIYQSAVLKALRRGTITQAELHPVLRGWLDALELKIIPQADTVGLGWLARVSAGWTYRRVLFVVLFVVWFAFFARFYVGYFFIAHPYIGFLDHPMIQLPCFDFIPVHLRLGQDL